MKKKKTIYFLLPLILMVWGFVFVQLYNYFISEPSYAKEEIKEEVNIDEIKQDTFSIVADYRDPFLGRRVKPKRHGFSTSNVKKNKRQITKTKVEKPWPLIAYNGMIKNNNSDRRVGIVKVDGKERLVKERDVVSEITIISIDKNKIKVRFQKENKTITK